MGLLKPATNTTAYAKIGILGFAGSGKSYTGAHIAMGLAKKRGSKSVAYYDTEKGSDFLITKFKAQEIELLTLKGRSFSDLLTIIRECEKDKISTLVIDSISHIWRELCRSYQTKKNKKQLTMYDWNILKEEWRQYTDLYINSKVDIIMLGRAGYEYEITENEDTGKNEMIKSGTKMKVEGETGFEPDLLLEMERVETKAGIVNRCWVVKDRSDTMNGKMIDQPKFESFNSFWGTINFQGEHFGIDTNRNSENLFDDPDHSEYEKRKKKEIALEELQNILIKMGLSGTSAEAQRKRVEFLECHFGTASRTAIEKLHYGAIEDKIKAIKEANVPVEEKKSEDDFKMGN